MSLQQLSSTLKSLPKPATRWTLLLIGTATVITGAIVYYGISQFGSINKSFEPIQTASAPQ